MPLISAKKQKVFAYDLIRIIDLVEKHIGHDSTEKRKVVAFLIWKILTGCYNTDDKVDDCLNVLGIIEDTRLTYWQFNGAPQEANAMFRRFNEISQET